MRLIGLAVFAFAMPAAAADLNASLCPAPAPPIQSCAQSRLPPIALTVCSQMVTDGPVTIAPRATTLLWANLAVRGFALTRAPLAVAGWFTTGWAFENDARVDVGGQLMAGSDWFVFGPATINSDAFVSGVLYTRDSLMVNGDLTVYSLFGGGAISSHASRFAVSSPPMDLPCDFAPTVADLVANVGDSGALSPDALIRDEPLDATLGCGSYRLSGLDLRHGGHIRVRGPTVIAVIGDAHFGDATTIDLAPGATLEILVTGRLFADGPLTLGDVRRGVWLAIGSAVRFAGPTTLYGELYAQSSTVDVLGSTAVFGRAAVGTLRTRGALRVADGPAPLCRPR